MYRAYVYYLRGSKAKDFETQEIYAQKILSKGKAARVIIEDIAISSLTGFLKSKEV